jgi:predicted nucleic acid-binding protein
MPVRFAVDSNCLIAAVCDWHVHHRVTAAALERRLDDGEQMVVAAHTLTEAYAVLTRFPAPHRLAPGDAWAVLDVSFAQTATVISLPASQHVAFLARMGKRGIAGGRVYDALIAACATKAGARTLLTLTARHFDFATKELAIVTPA